MSNLIPNQNSWIGFATTIASPTLVPTHLEVAAAVDLTDFIVTITASTTGNTVPAPRLRSLFEPNVPGTAAAQFTATMYRDDTTDTAWDTLPRNTKGFFIISRFGGTGALHLPVAGDKVEVWPVRVSSRSGDALQSGTVQTFTLTCAVPQEPNEAAVVT